MPTALLIPNEVLSGCRCLVGIFVWSEDSDRSFRLACGLRESVSTQQPSLFQGAAFVTGGAVCPRPWRIRLGVRKGERPSLVTVNCREQDAPQITDFLLRTARGFGVVLD